MLILSELNWEHFTVFSEVQNIYNSRELGQWTQIKNSCANGKQSSLIYKFYLKQQLSPSLIHVACLHDFWEILLALLTEFKRKRAIIFFCCCCLKLRKLRQIENEDSFSSKMVISKRRELLQHSSSEILSGRA